MGRSPEDQDCGSGPVPGAPLSPLLGLAVPALWGTWQTVPSRHPGNLAMRWALGRGHRAVFSPLHVSLLPGPLKQASVLRGLSPRERGVRGSLRGTVTHVQCGEVEEGAVWRRMEVLRVIAGMGEGSTVDKQGLAPG